MQSSNLSWELLKFLVCTVQYWLNDDLPHVWGIANKLIVPESRSVFSFHNFRCVWSEGGAWTTQTSIQLFFFYLVQITGKVWEKIRTYRASSEHCNTMLWSYRRLALAGVSFSLAVAGRNRSSHNYKVEKFYKSLINYLHIRKNPLMNTLWCGRPPLVW